MPQRRGFRPSTLTPFCKPSGRALLGVVFFLVEVLAADLLFRHIGELEDEIDHLVFINRSTKLGQRIGVVAIVVPDLLFAAGHLAGAKRRSGTTIATTPMRWPSFVL